MNIFPIETAPRDGRKIIVFGGYFDSDGQEDGMRVDPDGCQVFTSKSGRFFVEEDSWTQIVKATHWRELTLKEKNNA